MKTNDTILAAGARAVAMLDDTLASSEDVMLALSIALGRMCADRKVNMVHVVAVAEVAYRETCAELEEQRGEAESKSAGAQVPY